MTQLPEVAAVQQRLGTCSNRQLFDIYAAATVQSASDEIIAIRLLTRAELLRRMALHTASKKKKPPRAPRGPRPELEGGVELHLYSNRRLLDAYATAVNKTSSESLKMRLCARDEILHRMRIADPTLKRPRACKD